MTLRRLTAVIGVSIAVTAGVLRAQAVPARPVQTESQGRYQIVINPSVRADTFLLDTVTGRVWKPTVYNDLEGDPVVWKIQDRVDNDQQFDDWAKGFKLKQK